MRINYLGQGTDDNARHALITNIKRAELDKLEDILRNEGHQADIFSSGSNEGTDNEVYITMSDREDYEDFKDTTYKTFKKNLK